MLALALAAVVIAASTADRGPAALPEGPVVVAHPLGLRGTPEQIARLRRAVHGQTEGADALVTRTALHDVPVLRDANRLSEEDVTGTGGATVTVPDLDEFVRQRTATVLVFCVAPSAVDWTLRGTVGRGTAARTWTQRGRGADCSALSAATAPLPADLHETTLTVRADRGVRLLAILETVG